VLYITRKEDESIIVNSNIEVKIIAIKGKSVKLAVTFPNNATVLRKELYDKIASQNIQASQILPQKIISEND